MGYERLEAPQWMRQALQSLTNVPDLPSSEDGMTGSMVPVIHSRVWRNLVANVPLFVARGESRGEVALNAGSMYYAYVLDYPKYEASVAEALDLPSFKGTIDRSYAILLAARERDRFLFVERPDPVALYKYLIKVVLIRLLTESPYLAAQYREMLRYGAQQSAFRKGVVVSARQALLALLDATAADHDRKVDVQNKSDRAAATAALQAEIRAKQAAADAAQRRSLAHARKTEGERLMAASVETSNQLNAALVGLKSDIMDASNNRLLADHELEEAKLFRTSRVDKSREQARYEQQMLDRSRASFQAAESLSSSLQLSLSDLQAQLDANAEKLRTAEREARDNAAATRARMQSKSAAMKRVSELQEERTRLLGAIADLNMLSRNLAHQTAEDNRESARLAAAIKGMGGDADLPALHALKTQMDEITANVKQYDARAADTLQRKAKNESCLAGIVAAEAAASKAAESARVASQTAPAASSSATTASCYGATASDTCFTCDDVVRAYQGRGWAFDKSNFAQCPESSKATPNASASCYGASASDTCFTCDDVVRAYQGRGWAYDKSKFAQCPESSKATPNASASCYGASASDTCFTCDDVVRAYQGRGWAFDKSKFAQCK
jgi:hypothetical protein